MRAAFPPCSSAIRCGTSLAAVPVEIRVTAVAGGPAPFPELVTNDYRRDFSVKVTLPELVGHGGDQTACPMGVGPVEASLTFSRTAADFEVNPTARCICD